MSTYWIVTLTEEEREREKKEKGNGRPIQDGTREHPFSTIQMAASAVKNGDVIYCVESNREDI